MEDSEPKMLGTFMPAAWYCGIADQWVLGSSNEKTEVVSLPSTIDEIGALGFLHIHRI